ncbi:hypothetical protein [Streptomyces sp. NEAU-W12]|uniref:hypothetical protein n=1 Tax=Streptomyces sp. NEAU-W12 TaxID=2994668 RepID=UPI00224B509A|nr:hypothetical protein [Streptomyces sp. NEAU-W12]
MTRNHIEVWHGKVLPAGAAPLTFRIVLLGSLLPLLVWTGIAGFVHFFHHPAVTVVPAGLFVLSLLSGFALRRRAGHTARRSLHGAVGRVLDRSMAGF